MSDPYNDADYATRVYLQELDELLDGRALDSGSVLVTISAGHDARCHAVIFDADAEDGERAIVVVRLDTGPDAMSVPDAATATFQGRLQPGHAVAVQISERLYLPAGPAFEPGPLVPRFGSREAPSWAVALPGYLSDPRHWRTRSVLPGVAAISGLGAATSHSPAALVVCALALTWFGVVYRRWRSTADPFDDGSGPIEW